MPAIRDPRRHRRYTEARRAYLNSLPDQVTCVLCGAPLSTRIDGRWPHGPTIEHRLPIRTILATATSNAEALALALDVALWAVAHKRCQSGQGGRVKGRSGPPRASYVPSRDW